MEIRVHKLLIMVGEEGAHHDVRDFKKLTDIIIEECLTGTNKPDDPADTFANYLTSMLVRIVCHIPQKQHFYAGLTASISRQYDQLAKRIIDTALATLQDTLNNGKVYESINLLHYFGELMNVSLLNSLALLNLLEDIVAYAEQEHDGNARNGLLTIVARCLPVCSYSLHEKLFHESKRLLQRVKKLIDHDELVEWVQAQFGRSKPIDCSLMPRLESDFGQMKQINPKFKLTVDTTSLKTFVPIAYYSWNRPREDELYREYKSGEGQVARCIIEQLIETFSSNRNLLLLKTINLISQRGSMLAVRHCVETLVSKALKCRRAAPEYSLLLGLCIHEQLAEGCRKFVEECLAELFALGEYFDLTTLMSFSTLLSFMVNNWAVQWDWSVYLQEEHSFLKRQVCLRLTLEKVALLNDKFVASPPLAKYEWPRQFGNEEDYKTSEQMETFEHFTQDLKHKAEAKELIAQIDSEQKYEIFLQALFRRMSQSETHLNVLSGRYCDLFLHCKDYDWTLINKIRNYFRNSLFHRLQYLRNFIARGLLTYSRYVQYVGGLANKTPLEMEWVKVELNELHTEFGKTIKHK